MSCKGAQGKSNSLFMSPLPHMHGHSRDTPEIEHLLTPQAAQSARPSSHKGNTEETASRVTRVQHSELDICKQKPGNVLLELLLSAHQSNLPHALLQDCSRHLSREARLVTFRGQKRTHHEVCAVVVDSCTARLRSLGRYTQCTLLGWNLDHKSRPVARRAES